MTAQFVFSISLRESLFENFGHLDHTLSCRFSTIPFQTTVDGSFLLHQIQLFEYGIFQLAILLMP